VASQILSHSDYSLNKAQQKQQKYIMIITNYLCLRPPPGFLPRPLPGIAAAAAAAASVGCSTIILPSRNACDQAKAKREEEKRKKEKKTGRFSGGVPKKTQKQNVHLRVEQNFGAVGKYWA
jgi:hypothetical protein